MTRQLHYIIYAALLLAAGAGCFMVIRNVFPAMTITEQNPVFCAIQSFPGDSLSTRHADGQLLFRSQCASCHIIGKDATGPDLLNFEGRGPWKDRQKLYKWMRDPEKFIRKDAYAGKLQQAYGGAVMTAFPDLTDKEIDALAAFLNSGW